MTPDRLLTLHHAAEDAAKLALSAAQERNSAIMAACAGEMTVRQVARLLDLSETRIHAILRAHGR